MYVETFMLFQSLSEMSMNVKYPMIIKIVTLPAAAVLQIVAGLFQSVSQLFQIVAFLYLESFPMFSQCFLPVCTILGYYNF